MRCAIVTAVFPPEPVVSAQTSYDVAAELARRGVEVDVLAPFPNRPAGVLAEGARRRLFSTELRDGFRVVHCFATLSPSGSMIARLLENLSFGVTSSMRLLLLRRPDVIYSNSWPVFATAMIMIVARWRQIPVVMSVQDLYPESLFAQKRLKPASRLAHFLRAVDRRNARMASHVIMISERFANVYRNDRGIEPARLSVIPNWGASFERASDAEVHAYRQRLGVPKDAFLVAYGGNVGRAAGVEHLIDAMAFLRDEPRIWLTVAGDGSQLPAVRERAAKHGLTRVIFRSPWPREETALLLPAADLLLLPTSGAQSQASVPSKLISYLFAGVPVLATALDDSDTASVIREADAGWTIPPDAPERLAAQLRAIANEPSAELARRGVTARTYAMSNLDRAIALPRVLKIIEEAAG